MPGLLYMLPRSSVMAHHTSFKALTLENLRLLSLKSRKFAFLAGPGSYSRPTQAKRGPGSYSRSYRTGPRLACVGRLLKPQKDCLLGQRHVLRLGLLPDLNGHLPNRAYAEDIGEERRDEKWHEKNNEAGAPLPRPAPVGDRKDPPTDRSAGSRPPYCRVGILDDEFHDLSNSSARLPKPVHSPNSSRGDAA
jgi:hypothetical protein